MTLIALAASGAWVELARRHVSLVSWTARAGAGVIHRPPDAHPGLAVAAAPPLENGASPASVTPAPTVPGVTLVPAMTRPDLANAPRADALDRARFGPSVEATPPARLVRGGGKGPAFVPHLPGALATSAAGHGSDDVQERGNRRHATGYQANPMSSHASLTGPSAADPNVVARQLRTWVDHSVRQYCYQRALRDDPGLRGRIDIVMTVASEGRVANVDVSSSLNHTLAPASELGACVTRNLRGRALPAPHDGETRLTFGFDLSPGQS